MRPNLSSSLLRVEIWTSLSVDDRRAFTGRLTRAAVWSNVLYTLAQAEDIRYRPGLARAIRHEPPGDPADDLLVEFTTFGSPATVRAQPASLVVDATGFNAAWFATLMPQALSDQVQNDVARMRIDMAGSLALPLTGAPPLHAPALSQVVSQPLRR